MFYVYILRSVKDNGLYVGRTNDVKRRLSEHNRGAVSSTKSRRPLYVLKVVEMKSEIESVRVEREYKKGYKREQIKQAFGL